MMARLEQRIVIPIAAVEPEIARWLFIIEDTRRRTLELLEGIGQRTIDWVPPEGGITIGTLLYHIPLIEADYLYVDVLGLEDYPAELATVFPYPDRDEFGRLTVVSGVELDVHLQRMAWTRQWLLAAFAQMTLTAFRTPRAVPGYEITPEWTLHHLAQHEAEHRGQIGELRQRAERP
jgi:uncharacterized damage-inducible protein DinB